MDAAQLIKDLGGPAKLAAALGAPANTIAYWGHRNKIPADRWLEVWRLALAAGLDWEPPGAAELRPLLAAQMCPPAETQPKSEAA